MTHRPTHVRPRAAAPGRCRGRLRICWRLRGVAGLGRHGGSDHSSDHGSSQQDLWLVVVIGFIKLVMGY